MSTHLKLGRGRLTSSQARIRDSLMGQYGDVAVYLNKTGQPALMRVPDTVLSVGKDGRTRRVSDKRWEEVS